MPRSRKSARSDDRKDPERDILSAAYWHALARPVVIENIKVPCKQKAASYVESRTVISGGRHWSGSVILTRSTDNGFAGLLFLQGFCFAGVL
jgi:hypothetical protein